MQLTYRNNFVVILSVFAVAYVALSRAILTKALRETEILVDEYGAAITSPWWIWAGVALVSLSVLSAGCFRKSVLRRFVFVADVLLLVLFTFCALCVLLGLNNAMKLT